MKIKIRVSLAVIALIGCAGCAGIQADLQSALPEKTTVAELHVPPATQSSASDVSVMDNSSVMPKALAQKAETAPEAAPPKPEVRPDPAAQKSTTRPGTATPVAGSPPEMVALNFDDADIYEVVNAMSDLLGVNFIIDQRVKGRVNIHTAGEIDKSRVLPIMETVFEMNNIAMIKYDDYYKIIPIKEAKQQVVDFSIGRDIARVPSYDRQMIQIVPLQYVSSKEVETLVKKFLGPGGDAFEYPKGNLVVIIERAATIRKLLGMINEIDIDLFAYNQVRFFKVDKANPIDVAAELEEIFIAIGIEKTPEKGLGLKFIPVERVGGVLAVSSVPGVFERIEHWVEVLDTVDDSGAEQVFIYFVENGKAEEIGDVLNQVYLSSGGSSRMDANRDVQSRTRQDSKNKTKQQQPQQRQSQQRQQRQSTRRGQNAQGMDASTLLEGQVSIVTDIPTNAVIVRAIPKDYAIIKRTMLELDRIPRQVLIEVLIAEVKLTGDTAFGVEWSLLNSSASIGGYKGKDEAGFKIDPESKLGSGFSYLFTSDELNVFLQAQSTQNKINILSSPHILAVDNKEARIEVGEEVPIVTSEYKPLVVDTATTQTSQSVEYRSTGIILTVTPRINERGLVAMDIDQEVSKVDENAKYGVNSPTINNRKASTSLVVQDGQTIIIGGLIIDSTGDVRTGIPFLSDIPLLGYLFGYSTNSNSKIELILMLTPHVVTNFEEVDLVTKEMKDKLGNIKRLMNKSDDYWGAYKTKEAAAP